MHKTLIVLTFLALACTQAQAALNFDETYRQIAANSFELRAADDDVSAMEAATWQAGALPNPNLAVELDYIGSNAYSDNNELFVGIVQPIELGGKRSARVSLAEADQCLTAWKREIAANTLFVDVFNAFVDIAVAQERVALATQLEEASQTIFQSSTAQMTSGKVPPLEMKKTEINYHTAKLFTTKQKSLLTNAKKKLSILWNGAQKDIGEVAFPLYTLTAPPTLEELSSALDNNPEIAAGRAEVMKASKVISLERTARIPDIDVAVGVSTERFYRDPTFSVGFDIDLPIFDRNEGNICRASREYDKALYLQMALENRLKTYLELAYAEWVSTYEQAEIFKNSIIPLAEETYNSALQSYNEQKLNYPEFLNARIALFTLKQQYLDTIEEYHHKYANVLKIRGRPCEN